MDAHQLPKNAKNVAALKEHKMGGITRTNEGSARTGLVIEEKKISL
jgi:hypothetical protein